MAKVIGTLRRNIAISAAAVVSLLSTAGHAAPGDALFYDNLNGNLNDWTIASSGGDASIGNETSQQGRALRLRWGTVSVTSDPFDAAVPGARLDVWIRRGADSFSEDPDNGEDIIIEYLNDSGSWIELQRYLGNDDSPGDIYTPSLTLPADALHAALQIRFRTTGDDGSDFDYWHVDDPTVTETAAAALFGLNSCMDFENGLGSWSVSSSGGSAGVDNATANSGSNSAFTRWDPVSVTSNTVDLLGTSNVDLEAWIRHGSDAFSEYPDNNEDFVIEYLDDVGNWVILETFLGGGTAGEIFDRTYTLPAQALHSGFQVRFRQTGGSGTDWDYWHFDDVCLTGNERSIAYVFEEAAWTGAAGEVVELNGSGIDGFASGGADTAQTSPAIAGNPGTCRYGDFDGVDDFVEVPDDPALDFDTAVTVGAWINARSIPLAGLHTIVSKDWNYEFHIDLLGQIFWYWNNDSGVVRTLTSSASVTVGQWHHVAIAYEPGSQTIYLDGVAVASSSFNEQLRVNDESLYIGTDLNFISRAWDGFIDEVNIFGRALSATEVQTLMMETRPCATVAPQFTINHDGYGINCLAESITVDVVDASAGTPLTDYNATVVLDSQSGNGTWQLISGGGTLTDATNNDGLATYDWPLTESQAVFELYYPEGTPIIDVDVFQQSDPGIRDTDTEGALEFSPNGFTVTAAALPNPAPGSIITFADTQTAGTDFALNIAVYGQTPNDPTCGIIESYDGAKSLDFWLTRQNPATGSITTTIDTVGVGIGEAAATARPVTFTNGQAVVVAKYKDVGRVQISMKDVSPADPDLAAGIRGATAGFVVKPFEFRVTAIQDSSATPNPEAADASGDVFIPAGDVFSATVTAYDAEGSVTPNYGQESTPETVRLAANLVAPSGGANPSIGSATDWSAFSGGSASGSNFSWAEVGIITLTPSVGDGDYLGGGDVTGRVSNNVGRFVPAYFDISVNVPTFDTSCAAGGFTYIGESFSYSNAPEITFTAKAIGGSTTQNYVGDYFKMSGLSAPVYSSTPATLDTSGLPLSGDPAVASTGGGQGTLTFSSGTGLFFTRNAEEAEFTPDIRFSQDVTDSDNVTAGTNPVVVGSGGGIFFDAGSAMRYGRTRIDNAYGSELVDLPVAMINEYFVSAAIGFVQHSDDSCTSVTSLALSNYTDNLTSGDTCALDTGSPGVSGIGCTAAAPPSQQFSSPPDAGDFRLTLRAPGDGNDGSVRVTADVPDWLQYDWDETTPGTEDPEANATFGIYNGRTSQIYIREVY